MGTLAGVGSSASAADPGTPWTWGANPFGQLGDGTTTAHITARPLSRSDVTDIAGGRGHVIALLSSGAVVAWGQNTNGQLGIGASGNRTSPTAVQGLSNVVAVAAGHYHGLALRSDGSVWTWGLNASGQLGDGTTTNRNAPVRVTGLSGVAQVAAGRDMSYALLADGTVWAWGLNANGELGDGTTTNRTMPVRVGGLTDVVFIAGGRNHGLAVRSNGAVWAWGDNQYGQIGDGTLVDRPNALQVIASGVGAVTAGAHHSAALRTDGTVLTWGRNNLGQLADGTTTMRRTPTQVASLSGVVAIGAGRDHVLAVLQTGAVRAWGRNDFGQLGDGSTTNRTTPVTVDGLDDAVEVHGGQDYSVALAVGGTPDETPPTAPGMPSGQSTTAGTIDLSWAASDDDLSSSLTYRIFRNGQLVGSVTSASTTSVSFRDTGLAGGSTHTYTVVARDAALNDSPPSPTSDPITVTSSSGPIFADDFSSGTFAAWSSVTRLTIDATRGSPATPSARAQVAGQTAFARRTISPTSGPVCFSERVNLQSRAASESVVVGRLLTAAGGGIMRVVVNSNGVLQLRSDPSGATRVSGSALGTGWVTLEICGSVGTTSTWSLYRNGVRVIADWSTNTGTTAVGQIQIGDNTAAKTFTMNVDEVVLDATPG